MKTSRSTVEALILVLVILTLATMAATVPTLQNVVLLLVGTAASSIYLGVIRWREA